MYFSAAVARSGNSGIKKVRTNALGKRTERSRRSIGSFIEVKRSADAPFAELQILPENDQLRTASAAVDRRKKLHQLPYVSTRYRPVS